jgi:hypothetical protein
MVIVERPCCAAPMVVEHPLTDLVRCEACAVEWTLDDPAPAAPVHAALAA